MDSEAVEEKTVGWLGAETLGDKVREGEGVSSGNRREGEGVSSGNRRETGGVADSDDITINSADEAGRVDVVGVSDVIGVGVVRGELVGMASLNRDDVIAMGTTSDNDESVKFKVP